jgi:hypothetical protein
MLEELETQTHIVEGSYSLGEKGRRAPNSKRSMSRKHYRKHFVSLYLNVIKMIEVMVGGEVLT